MSTNLTFNYALLKHRIEEKCGKQKVFAAMMDSTEHTVSKKLSGEIFFKQDEIMRACKILDISASEIPAYFFTHNVQ